MHKVALWAFSYLCDLYYSITRTGVEKHRCWHRCSLPFLFMFISEYKCIIALIYSIWGAFCCNFISELTALLEISVMCIVLGCWALVSKYRLYVIWFTTQNNPSYLCETPLFNCLLFQTRTKVLNVQDSIRVDDSPWEDRVHFNWSYNSHVTMIAISMVYNSHLGIIFLSAAFISVTFRVILFISCAYCI